MIFGFGKNRMCAYLYKPHKYHILIWKILAHMRKSQAHKRISEWKRIIQNRMINSNLRVFHVSGNDYHHHYYSWFGAGLKRSKFCESWDLSGAKFSQAKNFSNKKPFNVDLFHILPTMRISQSTSRGAFFAWRAPLLSWPRIMCSQVRMLKFLEPSREMP